MQPEQQRNRHTNTEGTFQEQRYQRNRHTNTEGTFQEQRYLTWCRRTQGQGHSNACHQAAPQTWSPLENNWPSCHRSRQLRTDLGRSHDPWGAYLQQRADLHQLQLGQCKSYQDQIQWEGSQVTTFCIQVAMKEYSVSGEKWMETNKQTKKKKWRDWWYRLMMKGGGYCDVVWGCEVKTAWKTWRELVMMQHLDSVWGVQWRQGTSQKEHKQGWTETHTHTHHTTHTPHRDTQHKPNIHTHHTHMHTHTQTHTHTHTHTYTTKKFPEDNSFATQQLRRETINTGQTVLC